MKHPAVSGTWGRSLLLACLPLCALAGAPPAHKAVPTMKAVPLTARERATIKDFSAVRTERCEAGKVNAKQSFRIDQKGAPLDGTLFISMVCDGEIGPVVFGFYRDGKLIQPTPSHPANEVDVLKVEAIAFPDVNGDGRFDLLAVVSAMLGHGPGGAEPFNEAAVWLQGPDGQWTSDPQVTEVVDSVEEPTAKKVLAALKEKYPTKK